MRLLSRKPYDYLLYTALLVILIAVFFYKDTVSVHVHDTKYVLSVAHYAVLYSLVFGIFWLVYRYTWKHLSNKTTGSICAVITILLLIAIFAAPFIPSMQRPDVGNYGFEHLQQYMMIWKILLITLGVVQVLLFINVMIGILRSSDVG